MQAFADHVLALPGLLGYWRLGDQGAQARTYGSGTYGEGLYGALTATARRELWGTV